MKLMVLAVLASLFLADEAACLYNDVTVTGLQLKFDEPIMVDEVELVLAEATGSIGARTLFPMRYTKSLKIVRSKIDNIEDGALCSPIWLHTLGFEDNEQFPILTEALLENCTNIEHLILQNTEIEPEAFKSLINLAWLEVKNQNFDLTEKNLESLKNLQLLELKDCEVQRIDTGALCLAPQLAQIKMVNNTIAFPITKSIFKNCNTLSSIMIHNKNRVDVEEEAFIELSNNISDVCIENVNIPHLTKNYLIGLKNVVDLRFLNANINDIDADAFLGFGNLKNLQLEDNHLNKINFAEDLNVVFGLYLDGNEFTEFDSEGIAHLPNLARFSLIKNKLTNINNIKHPKLSTLLIDGNNISEIDTKALKENLPKLNLLSIKGTPMNPEYVDELNTKLEEIKFKFTDETKWLDI